MLALLMILIGSKTSSLFVVYAPEVDVFKADKSMIKAEPENPTDHTMIGGQGTTAVTSRTVQSTVSHTPSVVKEKIGVAKENQMLNREIYINNILTGFDQRFANQKQVDQEHVTKDVNNFYIANFGPLIDHVGIFKFLVGLLAVGMNY
jgi:hypothetical protein